MLEAGSLREVLRAHDRARAASLPFSLELGAGGSEIQPAGWREGFQSTTSSWGHRPTLGLKLRAAANLIAAKLA